MLCGRPPFCHEDLERMYELIRFAELKFPSRVKVSSEAQDLITKLLDRNQETRFGNKSGFNEIKNHPFFSGINFDDILKRKVTAPFKPIISDKYDVQNFDKEFTTENPDMQSFIPMKNMELIKKNQDKFKEFK